MMKQAEVISMTNYDVYYFIRKFAAIPEEQWTTLNFISPAGTGAMCALGHCGLRGDIGFTEESEELSNILSVRVHRINDGYHPDYKQSTPRARILAALRDVACRELGEDEC